MNRFSLGIDSEVYYEKALAICEELKAAIISIISRDAGKIYLC